MFRIAFASCCLVTLAAASASAGVFDGLTVSYPTPHYGVSPEYVAAHRAASCDCGHQGLGLRGHVCRPHSLGSCASLWDGYCRDRHVRSCRTKLHTRYHWLGRPSCDCAPRAAVACCDNYPMCGCRHGKLTKGCYNQCPSCLGHHVRGFWNRCRSHFSHDCGCGQAACVSCGGGADIIRLEQEMEMEMEVVPSVPEVPPAVEPAQPEAHEARLLPALGALLPRN